MLHSNEINVYLHVTIQTWSHVGTWLGTERQTCFEMKTDTINSTQAEGGRKNGLEIEEMFTQHLPALLLFLPLVLLVLTHTNTETRTCYYTRAQAYLRAIQCFARHGGPCHQKVGEKRRDAFMYAQTGTGRK